jgi:hypothetical protein
MTGPLTGELAVRCNDPTTAIANVPMWTRERRDHVLDRWTYWAELERQRNAGPRPMHPGE